MQASSSTMAVAHPRGVATRASFSHRCLFLYHGQATNYHLGTLKAKLAKLRSELFLEQSGGGGGAGAGEGFAVARNGDARVALIGFPSGKRLNAESDARSTRAMPLTFNYFTKYFVRSDSDV